MKWFGFALLVSVCGVKTSKAQAKSTQLPEAPKPQTGIIVGTVTDINSDPVPGAMVALEGSVGKSAHTVVANDNGFLNSSAKKKVVNEYMGQLASFIRMLWLGKSHGSLVPQGR